MLAPVKNSIVRIIYMNQATGLKLGLSLQVSEYACMISLLSTKGLLAPGTSNAPANGTSLINFIDFFRQSEFSQMVPLLLLWRWCLPKASKSKMVLARSVGDCRDLEHAAD